MAGSTAAFTSDSTFASSEFLSSTRLSTSGILRNCQRRRRQIVRPRSRGDQPAPPRREPTSFAHFFSVSLCFGPHDVRWTRTLRAASASRRMTDGAQPLSQRLVVGGMRAPIRGFGERADSVSFSFSSPERVFPRRRRRSGMQSAHSKHATVQYCTGRVGASDHRMCVNASVDHGTVGFGGA